MRKPPSPSTWNWLLAPRGSARMARSTLMVVVSSLTMVRHHTTSAMQHITAMGRVPSELSGELRRLLLTHIHIIYTSGTSGKDPERCFVHESYEGFNRICVPSLTWAHRTGKICTFPVTNV
eukprot:6211319-Pyramimonas_sp.AAC.1